MESGAELIGLLTPAKRNVFAEVCASHSLRVHRHLLWVIIPFITCTGLKHILSRYVQMAIWQSTVRPSTPKKNLCSRRRKLVACSLLWRQQPLTTTTTAPNILKPKRHEVNAFRQKILGIVYKNLFIQLNRMGYLSPWSPFPFRLECTETQRYE